MCMLTLPRRHYHEFAMSMTSLFESMACMLADDCCKQNTILTFLLNEKTTTKFCSRKGIKHYSEFSFWEDNLSVFPNETKYLRMSAWNCTFVAMSFSLAYCIYNTYYVLWIQRYTRIVVNKKHELIKVMGTLYRYCSIIYTLIYLFLCKIV